MLLVPIYTFLTIIIMPLYTVALNHLGQQRMAEDGEKKHLTVDELFCVIYRDRATASELLSRRAVR